MDRRSWLWRKKSSEKSPGGETESSESISSLSERYSDDQDQSKASPVHNTQSPEVTSKSLEIMDKSPEAMSNSPEVMSKSSVNGEEVNDNMKSLTEKLSAALLNISAKEGLVKQHSKVAEEAIAGWEKAENEVAIMKQQLEVAAEKNSILEDRVDHLDGALKECVRQLRQAREGQEQKIHEAIVKKTHEWESTKLKLEGQISELLTKVEAAKAETDTSISDLKLDLEPKLKSAEKEISTLKLELLTRAEDIEITTLERDLSVQAAETASKQHLESIKKVAKLEAECRRLRSAARKGYNNDQRSSSSIYVESFTDSQSDGGERSLTLDAYPPYKMSDNHVEVNDCDPRCSGTWASALIAELDQFKNNDKAATERNLATVSTMDITLMDDFLEMERLAEMQETDNIVLGGAIPLDDRHNDDERHDQLKADLEAMIHRTSILEEKLEKIEIEKSELEMVLSESQHHLEISQNQLKETGEKLVEIQRQLDLATASKQAAEVELESVNSRREELESQVVATEAQVRALRVKLDSQERDIEDERTLSVEIMTKCHLLEDELSKTKRETEQRRSANSNGELKIKQEKGLATAAGKLAECQKTIASLGQQLRSLATLEDFMIDSTQKPLELVETPISNKSGGEYWRMHSNDAYFPKTETTHYSRTIGEADDGSGPSTNMNPSNGESPPSSSSSSSVSSLNHSVNPEKSRNGFSKLFSRSKSVIRMENNP